MQDRYEAGEEVTIVGYTRGCLPSPAKASANDDRPLYGYLHADTFDPVGYGPRQRPDDPSDGIPLGRFTLDEPRHEAWGRRMSLRFTLPADLPPGAYYVEICQDPCSIPLTPEGLHVAAVGWPSSPIHVGIDPPGCWRHVRTWPLDDPAIEDLPDDALLDDGCERTETATSPAENNASERTETATSPAEDDVPHNKDVHVTLWLVAAVLLLVTCWAVSRLGPTRKQVRQQR